MLKTSENTKLLTQPGEGIVGVGGDSRAKQDTNKLDESEVDSDEFDGGEVEVDEVGKKVQKTTKSKNLSKSKKAVGPSNFLTPRAKLAFTKLRQAIVKALILYHFDPECHIRVGTDVLGYAISGVLSQLISDDLGQCHPAGGLFFPQDDSSGNQVQNAWRWAFSHCWGFQDLEALFRELSTWSPRAYRP